MYPAGVMRTIAYEGGGFLPVRLVLAVICAAVATVIALAPHNRRNSH